MSINDVHYTLSQIKIHLADSEDIYNYVPKKIMPAETGGLGRSHHYYNSKCGPVTLMIGNSEFRSPPKRETILLCKKKKKRGLLLFNF